MARLEMIKKSEHGREITPFNKAVGSLLLRAIDREEFTNLWNSRVPVSEIKQRLGITSGSVDFLVNYWEIPGRTKPGGNRPVDIDALAARLYDYMQPKIEELVANAVATWFERKEQA